MGNLKLRAMLLSISAITAIGATINEVISGYVLGVVMFFILLDAFKVLERKINGK